MYDSKRKELTISQATSPLNVLGVSFLSKVAYCARASISSALKAAS